MIKDCAFILVLFFMAFLCTSADVKDNTPKKDLSGLTERGGLPNFFSKIIHGDSLNIAYLGGSITEQKGWRVYSLEWFKSRFPKAGFSEINAAIGGTGSEFGAFRLYDHVLKYNPDLVFIEFAINDDKRPPEKIIRSMESIVRQIWQHNLRTDICFIYTIRESFLEFEQKGQLPASVATMEKIAEKYSIPSINFGFEVSKMVESKQLVFTNEKMEKNGIKVFSTDGVHPFPETGHVIYNSILESSFETMINENRHHSKKHSLGKPMALNSFINPQMIDYSSAELSNDWETIEIESKPAYVHFGRCIQKLGKTCQSDATLTVRFKGKAIGAYDVMGPDAGRVIVEVDGSIRDTVSRFDEYCIASRLNAFLIDKLEDKNHTVVFRVLSEPFNKAAILAKRKNVMQNPDDFKDNCWYVGKILVDGKLIQKTNN